MDMRPLHLEKAPSLIEVTESGITVDVSLESWCVFSKWTVF
jgi:hypothetical protein